MSAMKLRDFLLVLRTRWLIVLGVTLIVTGIAAAYTYTATPVYTAQAKFFLAASDDQPSKNSAGTYVVTSDDLNTYVAVLGSPAVMEPLRERLGLPPGTPIDVCAAVTGETSILLITAQSSNPATGGRDIANATGPQLAEVADEFNVLLRSTGQEIEATVVTPAVVPGTPTSPVPSRNLTLGVLAGLVLGIGIAFVRHSLDTKVRAESDIRAFSSRPMLGELPIDRSKTKEVTLDRDPHGGYSEAIRRLRTNLQFVDVTTGRHSFVVTSATPGEGKTTTTVNLAIAMATTGSKVLLVDGDLRNPSVARTLGLGGRCGSHDGAARQRRGRRRHPAVARHHASTCWRRGRSRPTPASCWAPSRCVSSSTSSPTTSTSSWSTARPSYPWSTRCCSTGSPAAP